MRLTRMLLTLAVSLVMAGCEGDGRSVSRGIVVLDHETRDGVPGLITITGGKLTTSRLRLSTLGCGSTR